MRISNSHIISNTEFLSAGPTFQNSLAAAVLVYLSWVAASMKIETALLHN